MENIDKPLISIGITCYREGRWLKECWESVVAQTDPRWEAIMVLDGGADNITKTVFNSLDHPRLTKFALQNNVGPYLTRTLAILNSKTDWYAHLDGDDLFPEDAVALIIKAINKDPEAAFVFGDNTIFDKKQIKESKFRVIDQDEDDFAKICLNIGRTSPFKREYFWKLGGFAPQLLNGGGDWDFWVGMAELGVTGSRADGVIYTVRKREGSVTDTRKVTHEEIADIVIKRHPDFYSIGDRKDIYLARANLKMARKFRAKGKRFTAADYAQKSLELGGSGQELEDILNEGKMSLIQYAFRRLTRNEFTRSIYRKFVQKNRNED